ncbi:MAG TPA: class I SAM-dependent methyltransferase [Thermoanaerobaculia bacterium]|nr:class I SAM-dependent methyltransferase [Thermoanaerobaculia bacterium]
MNAAKALYHRLVPEKIRNPIGLVRRDMTDRLHRLFSRRALPPRDLLGHIQMTPYVSEYLGVGKKSAESIIAAFDRSGLPSGASVLDFGCGSGRALIHMDTRGWSLFGCDIDEDAISWSRRGLPSARFEVNKSQPPLPFAAGQFDAIFAVSVFTHFDGDEQRAWARELRRILKPNGVAVISTMGPGILDNFPAHALPVNRKTLAESGFIFIPSETSFNARAVFHTAPGIARLFSDDFELMLWEEQGLDGFQDLSILRVRA